MKLGSNIWGNKRKKGLFEFLITQSYREREREGKATTIVIIILLSYKL